MMKAIWLTVPVVAVVTLALLGGCGSHGGFVPPVDGGGDPVGYINANGIRGGQFYDKFWDADTGWNQADPNLPIYKASSNFFRCKQCHGWDLLGRTGGYISRGPKTSRPNVAAVVLWETLQGMTPQQLFDNLKSAAGRRSVTADLSTYNPTTNPTVGDQMPDYGSIFTDEQLWDLVRYLKAEALDVTQLYDAVTAGTYPTGTITYSNIGKDGLAPHGDALFAARCAPCHGADGTAFLVDGAAFTVGRHLREKPYEDQHKIKFGQLGSLMDSQITDADDMKDLYRALADSTTYPN
jgi:thiosulfate dehydrogenase